MRQGEAAGTLEHHILYHRRGLTDLEVIPCAALKTDQCCKGVVRERTKQWFIWQH